MLHIVLMILKILGIAILILLGVLLLVIFCLLFVPVHYTAIGKRQEDALVAKAHMRWLPGILSIHFWYMDEKSKYTFRILGIDVLKMHNNIKNRKKRRRTFGKLKKNEHVSKKSETIDAPVYERLEKTEKSDFGKKTVSKKILKKKTAKKEKVSKIKLTIQSICDKIKQWNRFSSDETTKKAFGKIKEQTLLLVKHCFPKKIKGQICYGFDDPSATGQVLGAISVFYPLYGRAFRIVPDFTQAVLEGEAEIKGRIYGCFLVKFLWTLYFDDNVKVLIYRYKNKEAA